ncbi:hypothetical protein KFE80_08750 [bacterium SCSIO 12696]|nr:hypothetical protein KFE80_08750 [bacterium SCSIO 12696]
MNLPKNGLRACLPLTVLLLSACVNPYRAPISNAPVTLPPSNGPHRGSPPPLPPVESSQPEIAPPVVIAPTEGRASSASQAVSNLLQEGWALYNQERFDASISVAERGLRIDRRRAELYRLLSRNYLATLQLQQAEQLARQGLAISSASASERAALQGLLREIQAAY